MIRSRPTFPQRSDGGDARTTTNAHQFDDVDAHKENVSSAQVTVDRRRTIDDNWNDDDNYLEEQCGDSSNCRCCIDGKSFLPHSMIQNYRYMSTPNNLHDNYTTPSSKNDNTPKLSSSASFSAEPTDSTTTPESTASSNPFEHISFELSPPQNDKNNVKSSNMTNLSKIGCGPDTSIVILDSSDDEDNDYSVLEPDRSTCPTIQTETLKTPAPLKVSKNCDSLEESSPEAEWDGSKLDDDLRRNDNIRSVQEKQKHNMSSFIVSSDESDENENDDDEVEWNDSNCDDDDDSDIDDDLIQRTKEIIILSSDSEDDNFTSEKARRVVTKKTPQLAKTESKLTFRKRREELSQQLLVEFDRAAFASRLLMKSRDVDRTTVTLTWSNKLRTTAGLTRLSRERHIHSSNHLEDKTTRFAAIELSSKVIDDEYRLRSTLLHEMCHAAAWVFDGIAKPAHGSCFQKWAQRASTAIPDIAVTTTHNYEIDFKYKWVCVNYPDRCNVIVQRHSRSVNVERQVCGRCKGRLREVKKGESNIGAHRITKDVAHGEKKSVNPSLSAYNEFVRMQAPLIRQQWMTATTATTGGSTSSTTSKKILQSDVMKECARLWKEQREPKSRN